MKESALSYGLKWGISITMTLAYAFGAAVFYYLPARGEPDLGVSLGGLLTHFLVLSFLLWIVLLPVMGSGKAPDVLMLTLLTVPAGLLASLLFLFLLTGLGIRETYGAEYFVFSFVPFFLATKTVLKRVSPSPVLLAAVYALLAYLWGSASW